MTEPKEKYCVKTPRLKVDPNWRHPITGKTLHPLSRPHEMRYVILQNMGLPYNFLGKYKRPTRDLGQNDEVVSGLLKKDAPLLFAMMRLNRLGNRLRHAPTTERLKAAGIVWTGLDEIERRERLGLPLTKRNLKLLAHLDEIQRRIDNNIPLLKFHIRLLDRLNLGVQNENENANPFIGEKE